MTKHIHTCARGLQQTLLAAPWPFPEPTQPALRIASDAWRALCAWHIAGEHVYRVRGDESPLLDPDAHIAAQRLRRDGQAYILDESQWIAIGRVPAGVGIPLAAGSDRHVGASHPGLYYAAPLAGGLESGCVNLRDQPSVRHLRIVGGISIGRSGSTQRRVSFHLTVSLSVRVDATMAETPLEGHNINNTEYEHTTHTGPSRHDLP